MGATETLGARITVTGRWNATIRPATPSVGAFAASEIMPTGCVATSLPGLRMDRAGNLPVCAGVSIAEIEPPCSVRANRASAGNATRRLNRA